MRYIRWIFFVFILILALRGCIDILSDIRSKESIYVMRLEGAILSSKDIIEELRLIKKNKYIKAVILRINSPGGTIGASQEIFKEIERFKEETGKKIVCSVENVGASGAYYISLACDKTIALPGSIVGSIGVISIFFTADELLKYIKINPFIVKSGKFKDTGTPFRKPTEDDMKYLSDVVMELFEQFKSDVIRKRPSLKDRIDEISDAKVFSGEEALEIGLIDMLGTFSDAVTVAKEIAGIKVEPRIIWQKRRKIPFLELISKAKFLEDLFLSPKFM